MRALLVLGRSVLLGRWVLGDVDVGPADHKPSEVSIAVVVAPIPHIHGFRVVPK
jgi:hypothetical protein